MNKLFFLIYLGILFSSFVCSLVTFRRLPGAFKLFSPFLGVTFVVESIGFYGLFYGEPAFYLYHFYNPFGYAIVAYIYATAIQTSWKSKLIRFSIPAYVLLSFLITIFLQPLDTVNSYASMILSVLMVFLALFYFFELLNKSGTFKLANDPLFWISTGLLIFYAGTFFLEGFVSFFVKYAPDLGRKLMFINYCLNFILYTLFSVGFLCTRPNRKSLSL